MYPKHCNFLKTPIYLSTSCHFARSPLPGPNEPAIVTFVFVSLFAKRDHENLTCNLELGQFLCRAISFVDTVRFPRS